MFSRGGDEFYNERISGKNSLKRAYVDQVLNHEKMKPIFLYLFLEHQSDIISRQTHQHA